MDQIRDMVEFGGKTYTLIATKGGRPFDPARAGLEPIRLSHTEWRGYQCLYRVAGARLMLRRLNIATREVGRELFGVKPKDGGLLFTARYEGLARDLSFSGALLIGRGSISSPYAHLDFHPAWGFAEVHELLFEEGILMRAEERTEQIEELRERIASLPWTPRSSEAQEMLIEDLHHAFLCRY